MKFSLCCVLVTALGMNSVQAAETVAIESLLKEMPDRDTVAMFLKNDFRL